MLHRKMKTCRECKEEKPLYDFYCDKKMTDGHFSSCKECIKQAVTENRHAKSEYYREYDRNRSMLPKRVAARREYMQTAEGKLAHKIAVRWNRKISPEKYQARNSVNNAIRNGKLKRQPCEVCGAKAHAHHKDYSRPLDVQWLCPRHHKEIHTQIKMLFSVAI